MPDTMLQRCPVCQALVRRADFQRHTKLCDEVMRLRAENERLKASLSGVSKSPPPASLPPAKNRQQTREGFLIERCSACRRLVCVEPIPKTNRENIRELLGNTAGLIHVCDGTPAERDAPVGVSGGSFESNRRRH
jgi:hypothetical protein